MRKIWNRYWREATTLAVSGFLLSSASFAENNGILPDVDYSGSLLERSSVSGDWGGERNSWSRSGIQIDNSLTAVASSVFNGGVDGPVLSKVFEGKDNEEAHASFDNVLQLDSQKLGLWPGAVFKFRGEGRIGQGVNAAAGAISPVDGDMLFPLDGFGDPVYDLTEATATQFLSPKFGVIAGILNTLDGDALSLSGSTRGTAQFLNESFMFNPVQTKAIPYKTLGFGGILLPTGNPAEILISGLVMNTEDSSGHNPFSRDEGTSYALEANHGFRLFDRPGKQILGYVYGDTDYNNLDDPRVILPNTIPSEENRSYALYYSFEHYFYVEGEDQGDATGVGFFGRFGYSDGNPNPIEYSYSFGIGGNIPGRAQDTFGIGLYYLDLSDAAVLDALNVSDERGLELWYNVSILPWLHLTPDLQIIDQGLPGTESAYVLSLRTHIVI